MLPREALNNGLILKNGFSSGENTAEKEVEGESRPAQELQDNEVPSEALKEELARLAFDRKLSKTLKFVSAYFHIDITTLCRFFKFLTSRETEKQSSESSGSPRSEDSVPKSDEFTPDNKSDERKPKAADIEHEERKNDLNIESEKAKVVWLCFFLNVFLHIWAYANKSVL